MTEARAEAALDAFATLLRASRALTARADARLAGAGLTSTQFGVLEAILREHALTQRELSRRVLTSAGNMTDLVDKLEARGLVRRTRQKRDRRAVLVELTEAGRAFIRPLYVSHATDVVAAMSGLGTDELCQLGELLRKLELAVAS